MKNSIILELSPEQVLVLGDLVYRINSHNILASFFEDQAEQRILWDLECMLEANTSDIFSSHYGEDLEKARASMRDQS